MKKLIVLAVASLIATQANAAEMKWSGSAGFRYDQTAQDDQLGSKVGAFDTSKQTNKEYKVRANIGAAGGWENVEWGIGARTSNTGVANDDWVAVQNNNDRPIAFELAWFRYLHDFGSLDFSATIGRQKNVFAYDSVSQNFFDNDVRFDGFGEQFKFGMFGLNLGQYILGSDAAGTNGSSSSFNRTESSAQSTLGPTKFNYVFGFQPYVNWKFADEIEALFAVGFYKWSDLGETNAIGTGSSWNTGTVTPTAQGAVLKLDDARQWQFLTTWTLPYRLSFNGELVMNKTMPMNSLISTSFTGTAAQVKDADKSAWSLGLTYGALKKAHDFTIGYAYGSKGEGAVINRYTNETFQADRKGHRITVGYSIADNFNLGWDAYFLKEKDFTNPLNNQAQTGTTANQKLKYTYWELSAGVMF